MPFNIQDFASNGLALGGARPSLFDVLITFPAGFSGDTSTPASKLQFTCNATQLPASSLGEIQVPYFGRKIKLAGDRTFQDWTITVMNDEDFLVRDSIESWHTQINSIQNNLLSTSFDGNLYKSATGTITQYGKDGSILKSYSMVNMFPVDVSQVDLSWNATDQFESFQVTFAYDYWIPTNSASGVGVVI